MAKKMKFTTVFLIGLTVLFSVFYVIYELRFFLSAAVTAGTCSYHFLMRLAVGWIIDRIMKNQANYHHPWFYLHKFEKCIYRILKVKKWKNKLPTYSPELFDSNKRTYHQIAQAMCQAEIVHECIVVLSFLPVFAASIFGDFWVFFATSIIAAIIDICFVMIQRFNRPRIIKLIEKKEYKKQQEQV